MCVCVYMCMCLGAARASMRSSTHVFIGAFIPIAFSSHASEIADTVAKRGSLAGARSRLDPQLCERVKGYSPAVRPSSVGAD